MHLFLFRVTKKRTNLLPLKVSFDFVLFVGNVCIGLLLVGVLLVIFFKPLRCILSFACSYKLKVGELCAPDLPPIVGGRSSLQPINLGS